MTDTEQDLDRFLASVEGKLRGPFTPLELTKVMTTPQLRGQGVSIATYTKQLAQVFPRTEKVIQMRILIALAALLLQEDQIMEDVDPIRETILGIFADAETSGGRQEWVRMIAGLVENIVFGEASTEKVQEMLQSSCDEIIASVQKLLEETEAEPQDEGDDQQQDDNEQFDRADVRASSLRTADVDPTLAPFRYSLLKPSMLEHVTPEVTKHSHFKINTASNLLQLDARLDAKKAQEEAEHSATRIAASQTTDTNKNAATKKTVDTSEPIMPGLASSKKRTGTMPGNKSTGKAGATASAKKSSMFLAARKPMAAAGKTGLHVRKAGASQRLVGKGRTIKPSVVGDGAGTAGKTSLLAGAAGRSAKQRDAKGKMAMMMLDVSEVADLAKEKEASRLAAMKAPKKGFKRKAAMSEAANAAKMAKTEPPPPAPTAATNGHNTVPPAPTTTHAPAVNPADLAAAALSSYQKQKEASAAEPKASSSGHAQMGWRELLKEKNNLLSDADRDRIEKFFEHKVNPTPEVDSYDVKLHSERGTDPRTGESIKRTHYLKLNYNDWTSTQSKKTKRYKDD